MSSLPGGKVLLMGPTGTGKTFSLRTLEGSGVTPFAVFTEPGMRTVSDLDCSRLHWRYIPPANPGWDTLKDNATKINNLSFQSLTSMKEGMNKKRYAQFIELVSTFANFKCDRCGEEFGPVDEWGTDRLLFVDSLSGINIMAMDLVAGSKPVKSPGEWGVAMDNLERIINQLTTALQCHMVLTAHLDREVDEVLGGTSLMVGTLGKKLAPKLPRFFDDVVLSVREQDKFFWSTANPKADLKARNLPIGEKLTPSLGEYVSLWEKAGGVIAPAQSATSAEGATS